MNRPWLICGGLALFCHAALLFGIHPGSAPVPLPMSDTAVEVSLVTAAVSEQPAVSAPPQEPPPTPPPPPDPTPEPPSPKPEPELTREPTPAPPKPEPRREPPKPARAPAEPRRSTAPSTAPTRNAAATGAPAGRSAGPTIGARPRFNPKPAYPPEARQQRQQGRVIVAVQVSAEGRATSVSLVRSSGFPQLDAAAVEGVRRWTFTPAQAVGVPIPSRVEVPVTFNLAQ